MVSTVYTPRADLVLLITNFWVFCRLLGESACSEGSVTVVNDAENSSLQLVEMCNREGVWSPLCDNEWTQQDATVICREAAHGLSK